MYVLIKNMHIYIYYVRMHMKSGHMTYALYLLFDAILFKLVHFDAILFAPLFNNAYKVFHLWIARVAKHA